MDRRWVAVETSVAVFLDAAFDSSRQWPLTYAEEVHGEPYQEGAPNPFETQGARAHGVTQTYDGRDPAGPHTPLSCKSPFLYDEMGHNTGAKDVPDPTTNYVYGENSNQRLAVLKAASVIATFIYDGDGLKRVMQTDSLTTYLWDGDTVIQART
jgi:hypothetical protein